MPQVVWVLRDCIRDTGRGRGCRDGESTRLHDALTEVTVFVLAVRRAPRHRVQVHHEQPAADIAAVEVARGSGHVRY
jgi:hypothetical protein